MQRHLALLLYLFPLPKRRSREERSVDQLLDLAKKRLDEIHARHREQAVVALTQKNNLQTQVDDLQKTIHNLQEKAEEAVRKGENALADKLLREKQSYELSLRSAEETLQQAVETGEQVKRALDREEEQVRAKTAQILALQLEWKGTQIEQVMQEQLESAGLWYLTQEPEPTIDRQTARELVLFLLLLVLFLLLLVLFLLLLVIGLLIWRLL